MQSIQLRSRVNEDGIINLQVPLELANHELDVVIVYQLVEVRTEEKLANDLGYPPDFFEKTAGAWQGEPLVRGEQDKCDERQWDVL
ncbi:hypothetical protein C7H19_23160 [Aphanothece hegewaldii CCALA 016]|uniref:Uncharacterized protein n=1 Tax=Aphanothece hegewaldii CCALA 016 TaxID=2107694 RepID=A0A2T1LRD6_9CHRO|nr:hypothetical protein [Aphanothece hegewaldii]PSF31161.1 hypothetical protein C7H19_23160 [Aphanothece hegewaldii CCALA 016]